MSSASSADLNAMELEAISCLSLNQLIEAEWLYRRILNACSSSEGPDASRRDQWNLASVLVKEGKYMEAESILREIWAYLEARSGRTKKHFMEQEIGTLRLLEMCLGEEKAEEKGTLGKLATQLELVAATRTE